MLISDVVCKPVQHSSQLAGLSRNMLTSNVGAEANIIYAVQSCYAGRLAAHGPTSPTVAEPS